MASRYEDHLLTTAIQIDPFACIGEIHYVYILIGTSFHKHTVLVSFLPISSVLLSATSDGMMNDVTNPKTKKNEKMLAKLLRKSRPKALLLS